MKVVVQDGDFSPKMSASGHQREGIFSTAPKFFKIIFNPLEDTLKIPPEFMKRYGKILPKLAFLKVPCGSVMEVDLVQLNGETLLQKGWKEFKERYSIGFGHFLIFEYNGISGFNVCIFDVSATEINYPSDVDEEAEEEEDKGTGSDDSAVVLEYMSTINGGKGKEKVVENSGTKNDVSVEALDDKPPPRQQNKRERRVKLEDSDSEECSKRRYSNRAGKQIGVSKETSVAYQRAIAFSHKIRNPFFISLMQKSYVSGFPANVPLPFARANLPCKNTNLTIRLSHGKEWPVRFTIGEEKARLSFGWKDFVKENGLKVGDTCIFEVAEDCIWNVVIFRS